MGDRSSALTGIQDDDDDDTAVYQLPRYRVPLEPRQLEPVSYALIKQPTNAPQTYEQPDHTRLKLWSAVHHDRRSGAYSCRRRRASRYRRPLLL